MQPNNGILDIAPYVGGAAAFHEGKTVYRLTSNEGALGPSPHIYPALEQAIRKIPLYPAGDYTRLKQTIAEAHGGLDPARIVLGNGSDELIHLLCQCYVTEGDEVLYSAHGFLMYKICAQAASGKAIPVPEQNLTTDLEGFLGAITPRTKLIFLANPNNPTGTLVTKQALANFCAKLPPHVLLILDSAYGEFVDDPAYTAGADLVESFPNTVMLRTFSKAYSLAALRLGWGYFPLSVADVLNRVRAPFNINVAAEYAGMAAVMDKEHLQKSLNYNKKWRDYLTRTLSELGFPVVPSQANFLIMHTGDKTTAVYDDLAAKDIYVRKVKSYGLPDYLRVSVGEEKAIEALVGALRKY
jgi:histidinol-phosphate aminotransferase